MKTSPSYSLFRETACLDKETVLAYSRGKLSNDEKHSAELHLLDCELCSLAVAGIAASGISSAELSSLDKKVKYGFGNKSALFLLKAILTIVVVASVSAAAVFYLNQEEKQSKIISERVKNTTASSETGEHPETQSPPVNKEAIPVVSNPVIDNFIEPGFPGNASVFDPDVIPGPAISPADAEFAPGSDLIDKDITAPAKPVFRQDYNGSVKYIRNLKISDYEKHYSDNQHRSKNVYGVPSQFANEESRKKDIFAEPERLIRADKVLNEGLALYRTEKFGAAVAKFAILLSYNLSDENALFYSGICHYRTKQYTSAAKCFDAILSGENNVFHQEAKWYLGLTRIEEGKMREAESLLTQIVVQNGFYRQQAEEKLKEILK